MKLFVVLFGGGGGGQGGRGEVSMIFDICGMNISCFLS